MHAEQKQMADDPVLFLLYLHSITFTLFNPASLWTPQSISQLNFKRWSST